MTLELRIRPLAESDVADVAAASRVDRGTLLAEVTSWQVQKSPTVVARSLDGAFVGFARARPIEVEVGPRPEGQVAELTELYVLPSARLQGAGTAIVARLLKTLRLLGFARVVAAANDTTADWLGARDWDVLPDGTALAWVEPFIPRDDLWNPDLRSGVFSPVLWLEAPAGRSRQAWIRLAEHPALVEARYTTDDDDATTAIARAVADSPGLADTLPRLLRAMLDNEA
jgi:GNAT superfamily N-acetyltransferase